MKRARLQSIFLSALSAASLVLLALLILTMLTGATHIARDYAALMETQVRQHLWSALPGNPLAWVCLVLVVSVCTALISLTGYLVLLLHRVAR